LTGADQVDEAKHSTDAAPGGPEGPGNAEASPPDDAATPPPREPAVAAPQPCLADPAPDAGAAGPEAITAAPSVPDAAPATEFAAAEPPAAEPEPLPTSLVIAAAEPEPVVATGEPEAVVAAAEPEAVVATGESEPVVAAAEPEPPEPVVATGEPEAVVAAPEPDPAVATAEPEPVVATGGPEPVIAAAEPEAVVAAAEPVAVVATGEPEPVVAAAEPEPAVATAEPEPQAPAEPAVAAAEREVPTAAAPTVAEPEAPALRSPPDAVAAASPEAPAAGPELLRYARLALSGLAALAAGLTALVLLLVVAYRWVDPPASMLMLGRRLAGVEIEQRWVPLARISPHLVKAVVLSEDGGFCRHRGVDWRALEEAMEEARGGSTITMQVVKNLFLWPGRSYMRKAIEIALAFVVELIWPKRRILEIYLNIAEWGDGVFGAEAAARLSFGKPALRLTAPEAALLAVALPNPAERDAASPSPSMSRLAGRLMLRMAASRASLACVRTGRAAPREAHLFGVGD
jgi:monofunctional biosynthetic peptidoglycan transglycosylase